MLLNAQQRVPLNGSDDYRQYHAQRSPRFVNPSCQQLMVVHTQDPKHAAQHILALGFVQTNNPIGI